MQSPMAFTATQCTGVMDQPIVRMGAPHMGMEEELVPATEASCTATSIFMIEVKEKVRTC